LGTYVKLAWRNLLRNRRRTLIAGTAIGLGLAAMMFYDALIIGMENNMVQTVTSSFLGEGQIHAGGYRETQEVEKTIHHLDQIVADLKKEHIVEYFTLRATSYAMLSSAANAGGVQLYGIDPSTERHLSKIDEAIIEGTYLGESDSDRGIIIGSKLAEILEVEMGDRLVATVAQAHTGDLSQEMFRVSGIYRLGDRNIDRGLAFAPLEKIQEMLNVEGRVHEIAIQFTGNTYGRDGNLPFYEKYSRFGNEAVPWIKIIPQLEAAFKTSEFGTYIVGLILFGVIALGIINTLFMSLHERMFEFGVMKAVGTGPLRIAVLIVIEAGLLALISIVLGGLIGTAVTYVLGKTGIDYRGLEFLGTTIQELIYPVLGSRQFTEFPLWVLILTMLVGLYPAIHAARLKPAEAMRKSL
jgi:ABC-type lipoprotein release transport system permease subunit